MEWVNGGGGRLGIVEIGTTMRVEQGERSGGGGVVGLNRVYLAAGWLHFCIQVVLVLSTTDHATTQVM